MHILKGALCHQDLRPSLATASVKYPLLLGETTFILLIVVSLRQVYLFSTHFIHPFNRDHHSAVGGSSNRFIPPSQTKQILHFTREGRERKETCLGLQSLSSITSKLGETHPFILLFLSNSLSLRRHPYSWAWRCAFLCPYLPEIQDIEIHSPTFSSHVACFWYTQSPFLERPYPLNIHHYWHDGSPLPLYHRCMNTHQTHYVCVSLYVSLVFREWSTPRAKEVHVDALPSYLLLLLFHLFRSWWWQRTDAEWVTISLSLSTSFSW